MTFADLHLHTLFSDGQMTPDQLDSLLDGRGIKMAALTDHDCLTPLPETASSVKWIRGIELSTTYGQSEVHLLGYEPDPSAPRLLSALEEISCQRRDRFTRMVSGAAAMNLFKEEPDLSFLEGTRAPGRYHMARLLKEYGAVRTMREAFTSFLGEGKPLYEPVLLLDVYEGLDLLKESGALVSFAHPQRTKKDELIKKLADRGLDALEAYYPFHDPLITKYYLNLAQKYHMLATGGSDYHYGTYGFQLSETSVAPFLAALQSR
jgi:predicted metal-dependent phosphoesterase TrpH